MPSTAPSVVASNQTTAPGAGATLAATGTFAEGGLFDIEVLVLLTGTAETAVANVRLFSGAAAVATFPSISGAGWTSIKLRNVEVDPGTALGLTAIAAATGGAIYTTAIIASRTS